MTGQSRIQHQRLLEAGDKPEASDLVPGELAVNLGDGLLFSKDDAGDVIVVGGRELQIDQATSNYQITAADDRTLISIDSVSIVTLPLTGIAAGFRCEVVQSSNNQVYFEGQQDVILNTPDGANSCAGANAVASITCLAEGVYLLAGNITAKDRPGSPGVPPPSEPNPFELANGIQLFNDTDGPNVAMTEMDFSNDATNQEDGTQFSMSMWIRLPEGAVDGYIWDSDALKLARLRYRQTQLQLLMNDITDVAVVSILTTTDPQSAYYAPNTFEGKWALLQISLDTAVGNSSVRFYVNGYDWTPHLESIDTAVNGNTNPLGFSGWNNFTIGAAATLGGAQDMTVQELWLACNQYYDFAAGAGVYAFTDNQGNPIDLGPTGESPTGQTPTLYIHGSVLDGTHLRNFGANGEFFAAYNTILDSGDKPQVVLGEPEEPPAPPPEPPPVGGDDTFELGLSLSGSVLAQPQRQYTAVTHTSADNNMYDYRGTYNLMTSQNADGSGTPTGQFLLKHRTDGADGDQANRPYSAVGGVHAREGSTDPYNISWQADKSSSNAAGGQTTMVDGEGGQFIIDGGRYHNGHDPVQLRPMGRSSDSQDDDVFFNVRNCWFSWTRDECLEMDGYQPGIVEDCLIDGNYSFFSARGGSSRDFNYREVLIRNCIVWLRMLPQPIAHESENIGNGPRHYGGNAATDTAWGHGHFFKYLMNSPSVRIENSWFLAEYYAADKNGLSSWVNNSDTRLGFVHRVPDRLLSVSGDNRIYWLGPGAFPGNNFKNIPVLEARDFSTPWQCAQSFFERRNQWIVDHPLVEKVGDYNGTGLAWQEDPITSWPAPMPPGYGWLFEGSN